MFRRLFWLLVGAGFGFGVSFWLMRFVKQTVERYSPERVSDDLAPPKAAWPCASGRRSCVPRRKPVRARWSDRF